MRGLYRTDGKLPNDVTMTPWEMVKQLVWDVTVVDFLAHNRLNLGFSCNPGTTATEAEAREIEKNREILDNGDNFQPVALEVEGSSAVKFSSRVYLTCCCSHDDQRAGSFF